MRSEFLSDLGLARRAGKLLRGREEVFAAAKPKEKKTAHGLYISSDLAPRTVKLVRAQAGEPVSVPYTMSELGQAAGCKPFGVFSLSDPHFRKLLDQALNKEATI